MSKLSVALSVTFSKVYLFWSTVREAVGARPMKMDRDATLLLRLASAVTFSSGSTVKVIEAKPIARSVGTDHATSMRSSV